jgi:hypothetical protein
MRHLSSAVFSCWERSTTTFKFRNYYVMISYISHKMSNDIVNSYKRMLNVNQLSIIGSLKYNSDDDKFINYDEVQEQNNPATCFQL